MILSNKSAYPTSPLGATFKLFLVLWLLNGCASLQIQEAQQNLRRQMQKENGATIALQVLEKAREKGQYRTKDEVLYLLEKGSLHYFADQHKQSIQAFQSAEERMDELLTRSVSRGLSSILSNDNQLNYDGEDHEQLYVNAFNGLNYLSIGDLEGASVEIRRMSFKLEELSRKYGNPLEDIKTDKYGSMIDWEQFSLKKSLGNISQPIRNSAFNRYLSTIIYTKTGNESSARIEYQLLAPALATQAELGWGDFPRAIELEHLIEAEAYNTVLFAYHGASPVKQSFEYRDMIFLADDTNSGGNSVYLKFAFPEMQTIPTQVAYVDAVVNDSLRLRMPMIEHLDEMAVRYFDQKKGTIYIRALTRSLAKTLGVEALKAAAKGDGDKENEGAELLASIFGFIFKESSEQADLRSWQSLPAKVHAQTILLPPGTHQLRFEYFNANERLLYRQNKTIKVPEQPLKNQLLTQEGLFWN